MISSVTVSTTALVLLLIFACPTFCKKHHEPDPPTCNKTFNETSGFFGYHKKSTDVPKDQECTWIVTSLKNETIFLVFDVYLMDGDVLHITADGNELPFTDQIKDGLIPYVTNSKNITISIRTAEDDPTPRRHLRIYYYTNSECHHIFNNSVSGKIRSPLYDYIKKVPVNCRFTIIPQGSNHLSFWLKDFNFTAGTLNISGSGDHDGVYNGSTLSGQEFMSEKKKELEMQVIIPDTSTSLETFMVYFSPVSSECSDIMKLKEVKVPVPLPNKDELRSMMNENSGATCQWIIDNPGSTVTVQVHNLSLPNAMDQFVILDGPNRSSPVLYSANSVSNTKEPLLYSSGSSLWISAFTERITENFITLFEVSQTKSGAHLRKNGTVSVTDDAVYLLEVEAGKQVQLILNNIDLKAGSSVTFYKDFSQSDDQVFDELAPEMKTNTIVSPTEKMAIVAKGFGGSTLSGQFSGIDAGCYKYGQASGDTFSVSGHCNSTCAWTVKPVTASKDLLTFHFHALNLDQSDYVLIHKLDAAQTKVANLSSTHSLLPDLWLSAETGVFVQVTRGNCTANSIAVQSSYQVIPGCQNILEPALGESITITSPGYPNLYPLGAECTWKIIKPKNATFLHVSFQDIQLAQENHTLQLFSNFTKLLEFNGTNQTLPDDIPVFGDLDIAFNSSSQVPLISKPGFKLEVVVVEHGTIMTNNTGIIQTPDFPKAVNSSGIFAWIVKVNSPEGAKQILDFAFNNQTNQTALAESLKVYDGASLRSEVISNYSTEEILSRTNQLMFVYQHSGNLGPAFSVSYQNFSCNMSLICSNHICMHDDWHCNGINDCGDWSDERDCEGFTPGPGPPPAPPAPSEGAKGVSTAALAVGILVALVIGAVLGYGAPTAYKKLRGNSFRSYSSFSNTME